MRSYSILDGAIGHVLMEGKSVNGIAGVTHYFTRKSVAENLPIEISFVRHNGIVNAICRQDRDVILEPVTIDGVEKFTYNNDIIFDKEAVILELDSLLDEVSDTRAAVTIEDLFGIDISGISGISGFEFNKLVYIDRLDMDFNIKDYFEGYSIILHDIATKSLKLSIFVGTLSPYTYREYLDELNEVGKDAILYGVKVDNTVDKTIVTNTTDYKLRMDLEKYQYKVKRSVYPDKHYSLEVNSNIDFTIDPGETIEFVHEKNQKGKSYNLLVNPITPSTVDVYVNSAEYQDNLEYIREEPFKMSLKSIISPIGANDPSQFRIVSSVYDMFKDKSSFPHAIVDKDFDNAGLVVAGDFGDVVISDNNKFVNLITDGMAGTFVSKAKVIFKTKLRKILSALGEDIFNAQFDYMIGSGRLRILSIENTIAYNDTISTPLQALNINFGFFGNYNEIMAKSRHVEYKNIAYLSDMPCVSDRDAAVKKLTGTDAFTNNYVEFNINDVLKHPSKKLYMGSLYKTHNREVDDAYSFYQESVLQEINGYSLATIPLSLSSTEIAAVEPIFDIRGTSDKAKCFESFVYDQQEDIGALGLEIALEDVLMRIKRAAYIYRQEDELVASFNLGLTFDKEWYFCGEDFFPAKSIDDNTFTTYLDNEIVSLTRDGDLGTRHIYDKKIFFDSTDYPDQYKEQLHDAFRALVVGDINISTIHDNPGLEYITGHLLDRNNKRFYSYDEFIENAGDSIFRSTTKKLNNTMLMPNIFEQMILDSKSGYSQYTGGKDIHQFGKMRQEYKVNYADLKVDDAYDSAYEIGHAVDLMFDRLKLHTAQNLFEPVGKNMFGVEVSSFSIIDSINVEKRTNYSFNDETFAFAVVITNNDVDVFAVLYDYRTKQLKINNIAGLKILDYTLLIACFDIFLHDFYKDLGGKKRVSLGVYDFHEEAPGYENTLSKRYLLVNSAANRQKKRSNIFAVKIGTFDASLYVVHGEPAVHDSMMEASVDSTPMISAVLNDTGLHITKGGISYFIDSARLENINGYSISENGMRFDIYKSDLFIPNAYFGNTLTRATIEVVDTDSQDKKIRRMIGDVIVIDFGESRSMVNSEGEEFNFIFDGRGLSFWKRFGTYGARVQEIETINEVMNGKNQERLYNINNITYKIIFE